MKNVALVIQELKENCFKENAENVTAMVMQQHVTRLHLSVIVVSTTRLVTIASRACLDTMAMPFFLHQMIANVVNAH